MPIGSFLLSIHLYRLSGGLALPIAVKLCLGLILHQILWSGKDGDGWSEWGRMDGLNERALRFSLFLFVSIYYNFKNRLQTPIICTLTISITVHTVYTTKTVLTAWMTSHGD